MKIFLLIIITLSLVCGCTQNPDTNIRIPLITKSGSHSMDDDIYGNKENISYDCLEIYKLFPIKNRTQYKIVSRYTGSNRFEYPDKATVVNGEIQFTAFTDEINVAYIMQYDEAETDYKIYPIKNSNTGSSQRAQWGIVDSVQKITVGPADKDNGDYIVQMMDENLNIIAESESVFQRADIKLPYFLMVDSELYLCCNTDIENTICFVDRNMHCSPRFHVTSPIAAALRLDDGRVIAVCENGECMLYDEETQKLTDIRLYEPTEAWNKAEQILYGEDGGVYFINGDSITVQRSGEDTLRCDFDKSYLSLDTMQFVDVLSEDRFLIWYHNPLTGEEYPAILAPTDATERPMRQLVRVASIGTSARMLDEMVRSEMIYASIAHFNMTNDEYFIELTDFDSLAEVDQNGNRIPGDTSSIRDRLFEDALLAGEKYDVYLIGESYQDRDMLVEKGLFEDLTSFAERKRLIRCVRDAVTQNGQITGIPFSVEMSTLVTSTDILPAGTPFTYDKLIEIYENLEDGQSLFCDYTGREMRQSAMYDFIDFDNKTCSFDSAEFAEVFGFLSDYEAAAYDGKVLSEIPSAYLDRAVGSFLGHAQGVTAYGDIMDAFAKGDIKFLQLHIGAPDTLSSMLKFFDLIGKDYNLCGYPSKDGGTVTVSTPMLMSIGADCENRSGAYRYLSLLLSDLLQTQDAMYAFPVTETAVETRLTWGMQYYYLTQESGMYTTRNYGSALRIQFGKASKSGLDSLKASYYDDTLQVLKPEMQPLLDYVCNSTMRGAGDTMIRSIIEEELSYVSQGVRTAEEAGKIIQSRVFIYINE